MEEHCDCTSNFDTCEYHEDHNKLVVKGRPNTWFQDSHNDGSECSATIECPYTKLTVATTPRRSFSKKLKLQTVPHPWVYPEVHQELVERPTRWLGGCDPKPPPYPRRRSSRHITLNTRPSRTNRQRPNPIHIESLSWSVKDSPFLRQDNSW